MQFQGTLSLLVLPSQESLRIMEILHIEDRNGDTDSKKLKNQMLLMIDERKTEKLRQQVTSRSRGK